MNYIKLFLLLTLSVIIVSCDKTPVNGPLDGQWQIMSISTPEGQRDTRSTPAYLCFQLQLTQWSRPESRSFYAHFQHTADSIRFYDFAHVSNQAVEGDNDEWITPAEMNNGLLDAWGIHSTDITFYVRRLDGSHLVLERADTVLTFRKF